MYGRNPSTDPKAAENKNRETNRERRKEVGLRDASTRTQPPNSRSMGQVQRQHDEWGHLDGGLFLLQIWKL